MPKLLDLIEEKTTILSELGMTDKEAVKAYLIMETVDIADPLKREMKLDRVAHTMIKNFFDGDKQFVTPPKPFAYCNLRHCNLTIKQIKEKGCLEKRCWHFSKLCPSFIKGK